MRKSQLQTEISIGSTESYCTELIQVSRKIIPIIEILKEMKLNGLKVNSEKPTVHCRIFEDNSGTLEMARIHKFQPRNKHVNIRLHHFRGYITRGDITINQINNTKQPANFLTKAVNEKISAQHHKTVMGW